MSSQFLSNRSKRLKQCFHWRGIRSLAWPTSASSPAVNVALSDDNAAPPVGPHGQADYPLQSLAGESVNDTLTEGLTATSSSTDAYTRSVAPAIISTPYTSARDPIDKALPPVPTSPTSPTSNAFLQVPARTDVPRPGILASASTPTLNTGSSQKRKRLGQYFRRMLRPPRVPQDEPQTEDVPPNQCPRMIIAAPNHSTREGLFPITIIVDKPLPPIPVSPTSLTPDASGSRNSTREATDSDTPCSSVEDDMAAPRTAISSKLKETALLTWHGLKMLSKNAEKSLDGTPLKLPISIINSVLATADAVIDNRETLAIFILPYTERLETIINFMKEKKHLNGIEPSCERISIALREAKDALEQMRARSIPVHILEVNEFPTKIRDIFRRVDEATKNFELELVLVGVRQGQKLTEHAEMLRLSQLRPSKEVTYNEVKREPCMEGTREEIIESIMTWCKDTSPSSAPVYWLSGMAGTGKSTIAYTICQKLYGNGEAARRLGASFFCSRQIVAGHRRQNIIPTIAFCLAHNLPAFGRALLNSHFDAQLPPLTDHIRSLLLEPWNASTTGSDQSLPPLVVVIDALDELEEDDGSRFLEELINEIAQCKGTLQGLKFLVTSRRDPHIENACSSIDRRATYRLEEVSSHVVDQDIKAYLRANLPDDVGEFRLRNLVCKSSGLFIFAATIVRFVMSVAQADIRRDRLNTLIDKLPDESHRGAGGLLIDHLYEDILDTWISPIAEAEQDLPLAILQTVICTEEPILISDIPLLFDLNKRSIEANSVKEFIASLHAVLYISGDGRVCIYHKSFADFMLDPTRFTNEKLAERMCPTMDRQVCLATSCFRLMDSLRFNICSLPSSFLEDHEVPELPTSIDDNISSALRYACRHWAAHFSEISLGNEQRGRLEKMYWEWLEKRSLFWMEVMNLLGVMRECHHLLVKARQSFMTTLNTEESKDLLAMENLATSFAANVIADSTPHLYISALAASSRISTLLSRWRDEFSGIPSLNPLLNTGELLLSLRHELAVASVCFSPDEAHLVSGSWDKTLRIWEVSTGKLLHQLEGHKGRVASVCFSPDGLRIASGSWDRTVRIWDVSYLAGEQLHELDGHDLLVSSVCFSPDGTRVISGSWDKTVRVWDAARGKQLLILEGHQSYVDSVSLSPDGTYIVSASWDKTIRLWDASTGTQLHQLDGHRDWVRSVCFSPDGTRLVSGSQDCTVRIWDVASCTQLLQLDGHDGAVTSVSFSPDGFHIVSGSQDHTVRIWNVTTGNQLHQLDGHLDWVRAVRFSPDGTRISSASDDKTARIWDASTGKQLHQIGGHKDWVRSVCFSPDGTYIISGSRDKRVCVWDALTGEQLHQLDRHSSSVACLCCSPDGAHLVSADNNIVRIWDMATGQQLYQLDGHTDWVRSVSFSPDGQHVVSGSDDMTVRIWNSSTGDEVHRLEGHTSSVHLVCFSYNGKQVVSGSQDRTVRIWDASSGAQLSQLEGHTNTVTSLCCSPDGRYIVSGSDDMTLRVWDVCVGQQLHQLAGHNDFVTSVCLSPDGKRIVSGSYERTVRVWDLYTGMLLLELFGHSDTVHAVCFSPDGAHIISGSDDKTVRIWDAMTGKQLHRLDAHNGRVRTVCISPDGTRIVSGSDDKTVRIWEMWSAGRSLEVNESSSFSEVGLFVVPHTASDGFLSPAATWKFPQSGSMRTDWSIDSSDNGWIVSSDGERYMWLSQEMHQYLQRPDLLTINSKGFVTVDFTTGHFGTEWIHCYTPNVI